MRILDPNQTVLRHGNNSAEHGRKMRVFDQLMAMPQELEAQARARCAERDGLCGFHRLHYSIIGKSVLRGYLADPREVLRYLGSKIQMPGWRRERGCEVCRKWGEQRAESSSKSAEELGL